MRALAFLLLTSCIGAPDRATLEGGHGWGSGQGVLEGVKGVDLDGEGNWVQAGLQFPITYQEHECQGCVRLRQELLEERRAGEACRAPERAQEPTKATGGFLLGSGSVAALGAILAALMRQGYIPTIKAKEAEA